MQVKRHAGARGRKIKENFRLNTHLTWLSWSYASLVDFKSTTFFSETKRPFWRKRTQVDLDVTKSYVFLDKRNL